MHLQLMPKRFQVQLQEWFDEGQLDEGQPLVFEMTCHDRETQNGYNVHLTRLDQWFAYKYIKE